MCDSLLNAKEKKAKSMQSNDTSVIPCLIQIGLSPYAAKHEYFFLNLKSITQKKFFVKGGESSSQFRWFTVTKIEL